METVNHECYVSLEVAKLLKEAEFDWEGIAYYQHGVFYPYSVYRERLVVMNQSSAPSYMEQYSAPTLEVAQRWLREIKNTHIEVSPNSDMSAYIYNILLPGDKFWLGSPISYITYEEAQEAGIKKALEMILDKGE